MIDAAVAESLRTKTVVPHTMTQGEIEAYKILYELEEDRFFLEFPEVVAHRNWTLRTDAGIFDDFFVKSHEVAEEEPELAVA